MHPGHHDIDANAVGMVVARAGRAVASYGVASDPVVRDALVAAMARAPERAMFVVDLPEGPALGLHVECGDAQAVFVRSASTAATLLDFVAAVPFAFDILQQILDDPYRAMTVADHAGTMLYISPVHERFLGLERGGAIGRPAEEAIPNSRLRIVAQTGKAEIGKPQKLSDGVTRVVSRRPVWRDGRVVGAIGQVMFRDAEALAQMAAEINQLRSQLEVYRRELDGLRETRDALADLVGDSQAMQRLRQDIARVATLDVPVLIVGESGTGKELVARAIHRIGRPRHAMVSINLAALPASLVESELFGHVAGAFTGSARQGRVGRLELANDGTLFLDEVGDIPADIQIKLLRVLEDQVVERLGSHAAKRTSFRLVAATHRDMDELIRSGAFRHDLYYRVSGVTLRVPALRQRLEDLPALVAHFAEGFCRRNGRPAPVIEPSVLPYLAEQPWPGNLRQLRHRVEEALVFAGPSALTLDAFTRNDGRLEPPPPAVASVAPGAPCAAGERPAPPTPLRLKDHERAAALRALQACGGNKQRAAQQLGISRSYLYKLLAG
jgi:transcriptional regulator with PAS, ATPase and Fis domain